jgi:hypothetical protein
LWGEAPSSGLSDVKAESFESLISAGGHAEWSEGSLSSTFVPMVVLRRESVVSLSGNSDGSGSSVPEELSSPVFGTVDLGDVRSVVHVSLVGEVDSVSLVGDLCQSESSADSDDWSSGWSSSCTNLSTQIMCPTLVTTSVAWPPSDLLVVGIAASPDVKAKVGS